VNEDRATSAATSFADAVANSTFADNALALDTNSLATAFTRSGKTAGTPPTRSRRYAAKLRDTTRRTATPSTAPA
jgi:hypothetical protein